MYICLTGKAGSGKDTAADAIIEAFPKFRRYALADPIREVAMAWLGINPDYLQRGVKESLVAFEIKHEMFQCLDIIIYDMFKDRHKLITMPMAKKTAQAIYNAVMLDNMYHNVAIAGEEPEMLITTPRRILQLIGTEGFRDTVSDSFWLDICPTGDVLVTDVRFNNEGKKFSDEQYSLVLETIRPNPLGEKAAVHSSEQSIDFKYVDDQYINDATIKELQTYMVKRVGVHLEQIEGF